MQCFVNLESHFFFFLSPLSPKDFSIVLWAGIYNQKSEVLLLSKEHCYMATVLNRSSALFFCVFVL